MVRKMRHKKSYDENELKRLVESGKTRKKIAEILGISESAVDVGIRQQGLNGKNSRKKYNKAARKISGRRENKPGDCRSYGRN